MSEKAFDRNAYLTKVISRVLMLSDENLKKLVDLDINTPIEVNETIELAQLTLVREITEKTRKRSDEALKEAEDPNNLSPTFNSVDDAMDWLFSDEAEKWANER